jgi:hypothetical protein
LEDAGGWYFGMMYDAGKYPYPILSKNYNLKIKIAPSKTQPDSEVPTSQIKFLSPINEKIKIIHFFIFSTTAKIIIILMNSLK